MPDERNSEQSQAQLTKILAVVLAILLIVILSMLLSSGKKQTAQVATQAQPTQLAPDRITLAQFLNLDDGISYQLAVARLGRKYGTEISRTTIAGIATVMYKWQNDDASNVIATFQNDQLVSKAQFGLQ